MGPPRCPSILPAAPVRGGGQLKDFLTGDHVVVGHPLVHQQDLDQGPGAGASPCAVRAAGRR
jgi:hypothetical protein